MDSRIKKCLSKQFIDSLQEKSADEKIEDVFNQIIVPIFYDAYDIKEWRLTIELVNKDSPKICVKEKRSRNRTPDFKVRFNDKTELSTQQYSGAEILQKVVEKVGIYEVEKMTLQNLHGHQKLIVDTKTGNEKLNPLPLSTSGKFVITKFGNPDKQKIIDEIIHNCTNIKADIIPI